MPGGTEWRLILLGAAFLYAWIKIIIEIVTGKFSSDITKVAWLLVVMCLGIADTIVPRPVVAFTTTCILA